MAVHSLVEALSATAAHAPDHPALVHRDETVGYRDLLRRAGQAAAGLDHLTPGGGTLGLRAAKSPDSIAAVLACLGRGRPVLLPSVELGEVTLAHLLATAGCVAGPTTELVMAAGTVGLPLAGGPADPDAVALLLTTSGSTGVPKVVPLSFGAVDRFTDWAGVRFGLGPDSVVLNHSPLNFDLCLLDIWATLKHGGTVVLVDPARGTDGRHLGRLIDDHGVTLVQGVPMLFRQLADAGGQHPSVQDVLLTGESTPVRLLRRLPELFPNARFHDVYGCTETNDSLVRRLDEHDLADGVTALGEPLPGVAVLVVGDDGRVLTGEGVGELCVSTPFQTAGYLDARLDEAKFTGHPEGADDRRYFRSGDLVRRTPEGRLVLLGRTDLQVKVRGVRTNLADVEHVLGDHSAVAEAVVVAVPDPVAGHVLHAEVRRAPGVALDGLEARRHCADRLPRTAVPSTFRISDDPIPRTSTGKPDRRKLLTTRTAKD
ncbi:AMP-binding protein [Actinosynnema sp. CS-041913]|uniref:AMP-binding protein n=1 Tax=Actinosynnema sp. CS-041913 TaxID=3239917 RepID=UPI003D8FCAF1